MHSKVAIASLVAATSLVFFVFGTLIGVYVVNENQNSSTDLDVKPLLIEDISADQIGLNLKYLTSVPHVAGTSEDKLQAEWVKDRFIEAGFDEAKTVAYDVLLSYPQAGVINTVSLINANNDVNFTTLGTQPQLGKPGESYEKVQSNYNAFSAKGVVEGNLVYAYYGRDEDYQKLEKLGINVTGNIVLLRYGAIFRGSKVKIAEKWGAIGMILYADPSDKAKDGRNFTYPDSWWLPGMGVELGTLYVRNGDPLTPLYPSIESAYRLKEEEAELPKILVQPIGYDEAEILFRSLSSENPAPPEWVGSLNTSYNLGPKLVNPGWKVRINVSTTNQIRTTYNTIGILRGSVEEDRYVLLGNHRDSWVFGALDPSSGTATMLEFARALGNLKTNQNWRPRRTMVFCSWGAEEFGLIGSTEWTQQFSKVLSQRSVAYLNVDIAVGGNQTLNANAFPTLQKLMIDSSKLIPNPNPAEVLAGRKTVFDTWLMNNPDPNNNKQPRVGNVAGGSDYESFAYVIGMPIADFGYTAPGSYPTVHTMYDTYQYASEIVDRGFVHHQAVARLLAVVATQLADEVILPFDIQTYAVFLNDSLNSLEKKYGAQLEENDATLNHFRKSVDKFSDSTKEFSEVTLANLNKDDILAVRRANDRLILLERFFTDPLGLPDRLDTNHVVFSVSVNNAYGSDTFAGLVDLLLKVGNQTAVQDPVTWTKIRQHLSVIAFLIGEAANSLNQDF